MAKKTTKKKKSSRRIGAATERELVNMTNAMYRHHDGTVLETKRGQQHKGGPDSPDIITNMQGTHWEATRHTGVKPFTKAMTEKIDKATDEAPEDALALVFQRRLGVTGWLVTMRMCMADDLAPRTYWGLLEPSVAVRHADNTVEVTLPMDDAFRLLGWERIGK